MIEALSIYVILCFAFALSMYFTVHLPTHKRILKEVDVTTQYKSKIFKISYSVTFILLITIAAPLVLMYYYYSTESFMTGYYMAYLSNATEE